jgi:hypothetical protein
MLTVFIFTSSAFITFPVGVSGMEETKINSEGRL